MMNLAVEVTMPQQRDANAYDTTPKTKKRDQVAADKRMSKRLKTPTPLEVVTRESMMAVLTHGAQAAQASPDGQLCRGVGAVAAREPQGRLLGDGGDGALVRAG